MDAATPADALIPPAEDARAPVAPPNVERPAPAADAGAQPPKKKKKKKPATKPPAATPTTTRKRPAAAEPQTGRRASKRTTKARKIYEG